MVVTCCVVGCGRKRTADNEDEFFKFPTNKLQNSRWLDAIKLAKQPSSKSVVCSRHFVEADYKTVRGHRQLRALAVPAVQTPVKQKKSTRSNTVLSETEDSRASGSSGVGSDEDPAPLQAVRVTRNTRASRRLNPSLNEEKKCESRDNSASSQDRVSTTEKAGRENRACNSIRSKEDATDSINEDSASQNSVDNKTKKTSKASKTKSQINNKISSNRDKKSPSRDKQSASRDSKSASRDKQSASRDSKSASRDSKSASRDKQSASRDSKSASQDKQSVVRDSKSASQEKQSVVLDIESVKDPKSVIEHLNSELEKQIEELDGSAQIIKNSGKLLLEDLDDGLKESSQNGGSITSEKTGPPSPDCVMMVERVQVDIDPDALMMNEDDEDLQLPTETVSIEDDKPLDPVSLLTSSDEDDVILQEPHIDTVEVSDETDEEDVPLKRLAKKPSQITEKQTAINKIIDVLWGKNDFFCYQCGFSTKNRAEYNNHLLSHTSSVVNRTVSPVSHTVFICDLCSFQSSSKNMMVKHKKKHRDEKKHKCSYCEYRAKHRMSLVYHMKSHQNESLEVFKCQECGFGTAEAGEMHDHLKSHKQIRIAPGSKKKKVGADSKKSSSRKRKCDSSSGDEYVPGKV